MTMAPDLSFRGAKRRGNLKQAVTNPPGPSYDAAAYREIAPQGHFPALRAQGATAPAEPRNDKSGSASLPCHSEERSDVGISCRQFRFRRECLVIRLSAAEIATAPLGPRNDKSGSASLPCHSEERSDVGISCRHLRFRRGFPVFRLVLRDCHALLRKARNDKSRAFTVLTIGCQFRRYSAGSGMPLPYNITSHCKRAGRAVRPFSIIISFSFSRGYRRCTCARRSPSTRHRCQNTGRSYCP